MDKAIETVTTHASTLAGHASSVATSVSAAVDPYVPQTARDAAVQLQDTVVTQGTSALNYASGLKETLVANATSLHAQATQLAATASTQTLSENFNWAVTATTTTISAYTPGPVKTFIQDTVTNAEAVRQDPKTTLAPYVPAYVIHTSERTYEVVAPHLDKTKETVNSTAGYIVEKVNGTVEYVTSIPQVHSVIDQLNSITAPVLEKIRGGSTVSAQQAEAEIVTVAAAAQ
ncbi:UNVERIFIED_CONTAM: hypothetical protein HDU68_012240 [Siphonaria sp. JEL0065]|nr:hypothetical protein HDU68_012238 [Siphonaria sp. JEL0065]KAJ3016392.1 hypothetical protein HDU68_012240 [Siphonaria sp. JEL0065]